MEVSSRANMPWNGQSTKNRLKIRKHSTAFFSRNVVICQLLLLLPSKMNKELKSRCTFVLYQRKRNKKRGGCRLLAATLLRPGLRVSEPGEGVTGVGVFPVSALVVVSTGAVGGSVGCRRGGRSVDRRHTSYTVRLRRLRYDVAPYGIA